MIQTTITNAVVSKGYNGAPPVIYFDEGNVAVFRVGIKQYDKNAEDKTHWVNIEARASGVMAKRIEKMQIKEGTHVSLCGKMIETEWENKKTNRMEKSFVIHLSDIEFVNSGKKDEEKGDAAKKSEQRLGDNFTGYESFDESAESYFDE